MGWKALFQCFATPPEAGAERAVAKQHGKCILQSNISFAGGGATGK